MRPKTVLAIQCLVIVLLSIMLFAPAVRGPFIWDDRYLLEQMRGQGFVDLVSGSFIQRPGADTGDYYRPLVTLSLVADRAVWGDAPAGYHVTNLLLHALGALAFWLMARRLIGATPGFVAACLFAAHPAHCEAVCWISGRADLLAGLLISVSLVGYLRWCNTPAALLSLAPAALALLSKETAVSLVFLAPAAVWCAGERSFRRLAAPALMFGGLAVAVFSLRALVIPLASVHRVEDAWLGQAAVGAYSLLMHFQILILPHTARLGYHVVTDEVAKPATWISLGGLGLVLWLAWADRRKRPIAWFAALWFAGAMVPVLGSASGLSSTIIAERYVYVASAGLAILVAWACLQAPNRMLGYGGLVAIMLYYASVTTVSSTLWADDLKFWKRFVQDTPLIGWGYCNLGAVATEHGDLRLARQSYQVAADLMPDEPVPRMGLSEVDNLQKAAGSKTTPASHL